MAKRITGFELIDNWYNHAKYPMRQSQRLEQLLAEINHALGGPHLAIRYIPNERWYTLTLTHYGQKTKRFNYLAVEGYMTYMDLCQYLLGILVGLRAANEIKKEN